MQSDFITLERAMEAPQKILWSPHLGKCFEGTHSGWQVLSRWPPRKPVSCRPVSELSDAILDTRGNL